MTACKYDCQSINEIVFDLTQMTIFGNTTALKGFLQFCVFSPTCFELMDCAVYEHKTEMSIFHLN